MASEIAGADGFTVIREDAAEHMDTLLSGLFDQAIALLPDTGELDPRDKVLSALANAINRSMTEAARRLLAMSEDTPRARLDLAFQVARLGVFYGAHFVNKYPASIKRALAEEFGRTIAASFTGDCQCHDCEAWRAQGGSFR